MKKKCPEIIQVKITIYPNQLEWIERISNVLKQPRRQTFLECFASYIGEFKQILFYEGASNE